MDEPIVEVSKELIVANYEIDEVTKQWTVLKHEYRSTKDPTLRAEIKEKWDQLQKKNETTRNESSKDHRKKRRN